MRVQRPDLAAEAMRDPSSARHEIWSTLILAFFRYPQLTAMVLLVGAAFTVCAYFGITRLMQEIGPFLQSMKNMMVNPTFLDTLFTLCIDLSS